MVGSPVPGSSRGAAGSPPGWAALPPSPCSPNEGGERWQPRLAAVRGARNQLGRRRLADQLAPCVGVAGRQQRLDRHVGESGSPYQASRSAKASLAHSVTVWMNSALPGPMAARSKPLEQGELLGEHRALAPRPGLAHGQAAEVEGQRFLEPGAPGGQVGIGQQAAVRLAGDVHDLGRRRGRRRSPRPRSPRSRPAGPPRSARRGRRWPPRPPRGCAGRWRPARGWRTASPARAPARPAGRPRPSSASDRGTGRPRWRCPS